MNSPPAKQSSDTGILGIVTVQCCICIFLAVAFLVYSQISVLAESLIYPACVFLLALTIWSFWSWQFVTKNLFDPYILFFLSAVIFNGGQAFLEIFHLNEEGFLNDKFSSQTLLNTVFIVIISFAAFHLGALLNALSNDAQPAQKFPLKILQKSCRIVGWSIFAIAALPTIIIFREAIGVVLSSGYGALYQQNAPTSFSATPKILAEFLVPSTLFLLAGSKEKRANKFICIFCVLIYAISRLFLGERNQGVMPLIAMAWLWHHLIRPLPLVLLSAAALGMLMIFPVIAATRGTAGEDRLSLDVLLEVFSATNNPLIASISEMGGSMNTVAYTLELVPKFHAFEQGVGYLYGLLTIVPNLFWSLHPTVARGIPDVWLIEEVDPGWASRGGSIGFSFIAEAYLNFGWYGTPITMAVIGFLFAKLVLWAAKSDNPARIATVASFTSFFLFYPRAEVALVIRPLLWYALIPYLGVYAIASGRSKPRR